MAGLALGFPLTQSRGGSDPDLSLLYDINGLAKDAPSWLDRTMVFVGEYGIMLAMVLLVLWCWWSVRWRGTTEDSVGGVAALIWAPLAAGIALLINIPIRGFVERPRPFRDHQGIEVLVSGKSDYSFVSDHATLAMAIAAGLFVAHRRFGLAAIGLALAEGFCRVYLGVHYPTDVVGGFALGTAVALLLAPLALALLTPVVSAVATSERIGRLVRSKRVMASRAGRPETLGIPEPRTGGPDVGENGLAA
ncbi:phosphatase PAP2 family protein [Streptomyces sp. NBC_01481]|uniref:phosphatase PAP2 family protein n=1 Tax=Streptomyces sp. NBC_01481 TaxID=2975869 RepID=UPI002252B56C|nr:phosphatase PAP2 family protein [Streptomyces sp. NBC_01481]MCX4584371.1 phosphatase PAP2 family protein [Streptomyces sp. NBC_01481]